MKRINEYRKLFSVEGEIDLKDLKKTYRSLVKDWHPDKFQADDEKFAEAELKSQQIIDGYHFLISIAPETKETNLEEYRETISTSKILDFDLKGQVLKIDFSNGDSYEYFGVSKKVFQKLINSDIQVRFAKRNIYESFLYRKMKKAAVTD
jgi:curved DNA-binding protein CbpA